MPALHYGERWCTDYRIPLSRKQRGPCEPGISKGGRYGLSLTTAGSGSKDRRAANYENCRHCCRPPPAVQLDTAGCDASLTLSIPAHLELFGTTGMYTTRSTISLTYTGAHDELLDELTNKRRLLAKQLHRRSSTGWMPLSGDDRRATLGNACTVVCCL